MRNSQILKHINKSIIKECTIGKRDTYLQSAFFQITEERIFPEYAYMVKSTNTKIRVTL